MTVLPKRFFLMLCLFLCACTGEKKKNRSFSNKELAGVIEKMTDIMVHDVTNPPLAARFFSYACLAGYEIVSENDDHYKSMHGILNGYPSLKKPDTISGYSPGLAALLAMMETAKK